MMILIIPTIFQLTFKMNNIQPSKKDILFWINNKLNVLAIFNIGQLDQIIEFAFRIDLLFAHESLSAQFHQSY